MDRSFSSCNVKKKVSHRCGVVIFNSDLTKIALILNRYSSEVLKRPKWGLPKGHINKNKKIEEPFLKCAEREAEEETGLIIRLDKRNGKIRVKTTNYYPICVDKEYKLDPKDKYEVAEARWFDVDKVKDMVINYECRQVMRNIFRFKQLAKLNSVKVLNS